ncbi:MAG: hypothetical protein JWM47_4537 [Acidimicrobiales bacterium]|nr:hypothetical protein [Acidimicrobiales bacterium]
MSVATFGPLIVETDVDLAVVATLRRWLPTYLTRAEGERADALDGATFARPEPGSYSNTLEDDEFLDHQLPAIIVTTANLQDTETTGDGDYLAGWRVVVSAVVRGETAPQTRAIAAVFAGSVRRVLTQQPTLGGFAAGVDWVPGGGVAPVADTTDKGRYLAAGINHFDVYVDDVLSTRGGPLEPDEDPYDTPVVVDTVTVDVAALD